MHFLILILYLLPDESWIRALHQRVRDKQESNGAWKVFPDEDEGNLSATVEAYFALLYSGYSHSSDPHIQRAKQFIIAHGGITQVDSLMTKVILACCGQYPWPSFFPLPVELILVPSASPIHFYDFSGNARVHLAPVMLLANKRYIITNERTPILSDLLPNVASGEMHREQTRRSTTLWEELIEFTDKLISLPHYIHQQAIHKAEHYMLDRIEANGLLYSYASATFLMIFALLSLGYNSRHPVILRAVHGLKSIQCTFGNAVHIQNSTSTIWDTSLVGYALQQAGLPPEHPSIQRAGSYLLSRQHTRLGDWARQVKQPVPGGWGVCYIYGTWSALTGMLAVGENKEHPSIQRAVDWLLSIQHADGGWGESCRSDVKKTYIPLNHSTLSQTAWAVDVLVASHSRPIPAIHNGIDYLTKTLQQSDRKVYPTGAGLPGHFYIQYHSYPYICPLLTLSHYKSKFEHLLT